MKFEINFTGHANIRSNHAKTIEITKDSELTVRGDCVIGVNANYSCLDVPENIKKKLKDPLSKIEFSINVEKYEFKVSGNGHENLILSHPEDIVIRKSDFVCPRTLAVNCDKASNLLPREMVKLLQNPKTRGTFTINVE